MAAVEAVAISAAEAGISVADFTAVAGVTSDTAISAIVIMASGRGIMVRAIITRRARAAASSTLITARAESAVLTAIGKVDRSHDLAANAKSD